MAEPIITIATKVLDDVYLIEREAEGFLARSDRLALLLTKCSFSHPVEAHLGREREGERREVQRERVKGI